MLTNLFQTLEASKSWKIDKTRYLAFGNAFDKMSIILFEANSEQPRWVAKFAASDFGLLRCQTEYDGLRYLQSIDLPGIRTSIPLGIIEDRGQRYYLQTYLSGRLMLDRMHLISKRFRKSHFRQATDLLIRLYRASSIAEQNDGESYSRCFQHGDFWPGNVGSVDSALVLYDFEFSDRNGFPLFDLLHFGLYGYRALNNIGKLRRANTDTSGDDSLDDRVFRLSPSDIDAVLAETTPYSRVMIESIVSYSQTCGIGPEDTLQLVRTYVEDEQKVPNLTLGWHQRFFEEFLRRRDKVCGT